MKKALFLVFSLILSGVVGYFLFSQISSPHLVRAGEDENVSGFAWSENIGWVSFNSTSGGGGVDYGVNIDDTGLFSGYAWSENIGWLTFNTAELAGCPSGSCQAKLTLANFEVSGWARALSYGGGWDGWIGLRGTALDNTPYGVRVSSTTKEFEGFAWGGDVLGWLSFNCKNQGVCASSNYKVKTSLNFPPTATDLSVNQGDYCGYPLHPIFAWTFSDPDPADTQGAYWLQADNDSDFSSPAVDTGKVLSASNSYSPPSPLSYNTTYFWRVKVWDNNDKSSLNWIGGPSFTTSLHAYPDPNFSWSPTVPSKGEWVRFCATKEPGACPKDVSVCYNASSNPISCSGKSFLWTFPATAEFATGSSPTLENPQAKFNEIGPKTVALNITDDVGSCTTTKTVNVTFPLPKWKEIEP